MLLFTLLATDECGSAESEGSEGSEARRIEEQHAALLEDAFNPPNYRINDRQLYINGIDRVIGANNELTEMTWIKSFVMDCTGHNYKGVKRSDASRAIITILSKLPDLQSFHIETGIYSDFSAEDIFGVCDTLKQRPLTDLTLQFKSTYFPVNALKNLENLCQSMPDCQITLDLDHTENDIYSSDDEEEAPQNLSRGEAFSAFMTLKNVANYPNLTIINDEQFTENLVRPKPQVPESDSDEDEKS